VKTGREREKRINARFKTRETEGARRIDKQIAENSAGRRCCRGLRLLEDAGLGIEVYAANKPAPRVGDAGEVPTPQGGPRALAGEAKRYTRLEIPHS